MSLISRRLAVGLAGGAVCLALIPAAATAAGPSATVIAGGLNNPRGVAVDVSGRVYVAEAGAGKVLVIRGSSVTTYASG